MDDGPGPWIIAPMWELRKLEWQEGISLECLRADDIKTTATSQQGLVSWVVCGLWRRWEVKFDVCVFHSSSGGSGCVRPTFRVGKVSGAKRCLESLPEPISDGGLRGWQVSVSADLSACRVYWKASLCTAQNRRTAAILQRSAAHVR